MTPARLGLLHRLASLQAQAALAGLGRARAAADGIEARLAGLAAAERQARDAVTRVAEREDGAAGPIGDWPGAMLLDAADRFARRTAVRRQAALMDLAGARAAVLDAEAVAARATARREVIGRLAGQAAARRVKPDGGP